MGRKSKKDDVLTWYKSISSRRVDLVGDYAGSETFLVEFDSLLLQCFSNPKLNFSSKYERLLPLKSDQTVYTLTRWLSTTPRSLHR
jgi:hypothetical protein